MEIIFAIAVLALLAIGLLNRKKQKKEWVKEERFEESGDWLDKRSGERGTYGSLDEEMEANRLYIAKKSKVSELALSIQAAIFAQSVDFQKLNQDQIKSHLAFCKAEIAGLFELFDQWMNGKQVATPKQMPPESEFHAPLKKLVMDFSFERFPKLLDLEIEEIQKVDLSAAEMVSKILAEAARLQA